MARVLLRERPVRVGFEHLGCRAALSSGQHHLDLLGQQLERR